MSVETTVMSSGTPTSLTRKLNTVLRMVYWPESVLSPRLADTGGR
jgi:hypothetical protein